MHKLLRGTVVLLLVALSTSSYAQTYCSAGPSSTFDSEITNVVLSGDNYSISNLATCPGVGGVQNFTTTDSADLSVGTSYTLNVTFSTCGGVYTSYGKVWIDWNQDGDFVDAGEDMGSWGPGSPAPAGTSTFNANFSITVPTTATLGATRMRVMQHEGGSPAATTPCATFTWGAVEDYKIVVTNTPPPCPIPGAVTSLPAATTADISWISTGAAFDIEYGPIGFTVGTGTSTTSTTNTVTLTGLTPNSGYDVYVRNNCTVAGNGISGWSVVHTFYTSCVAQNMPVTENFTNWPPNCYTLTNTGSWDWDQDPAGHARARFWSFSSGAATMASNAIIINQPAQVKFKWAHQYQSNYPDDRVLLRVRLQSSAQWDTLVDLVGPTFNSPNAGTTTPPPANDFISELIYLDSATYVGQTVVFEFVGITDFGPHAYIDDFIVEAVPACPEPTQISSSNITSSSAQINWSTAGGSSFVIEYGPVGFTQGTGNLDTVTTNSALLTGLAANSDYDVYVLNDCSGAGNGLSVWAGPHTFRTLCNAFAEGYFENFDGLATTTKEPCWYDFSVGGGHNVYAYLTPTWSNVQAYSSPNVYYWYNSGAATSYVVTPELMGIDGDTSQIRFRMTNNYWNAATPINVWVGTMSDRADASTIVWIDTLNPAQYTWNEYTIPLTNVPTGHKFVVFGRNNTPSFSEVDIDDFYFEGIPACPPPLSATANASSATSIIVNWPGATGGIYNIEYGPTGFVQGTGPVIYGVTSPDTITGLFANSCYDIYIQRDCGTGSISPWFGPINVCTPCIAASMPYSEDFNNWPPSCFQFTKTGSWDWDQDAAGHARARFWSFSSGKASMTSGPVNITQKAQVKFKWAHQYQSFYPDDRVILLSRTLGSSQWDTLIDLVGPNFDSPNSAPTSPPPAADFIPELIYLDSATYVGQIAEFRFDAITDFGPHAYVDDFVVEAVPQCPEPTQVTISAIQGFQATVNWLAAGGSQFVIEYGPQGFAQGTGGGLLDTVSGSPAVISGLIPVTCYDVYVMAMCGPNGTSSWAGPISFCTLVSCPAPTNINAGAVSTTSATISWTTGSASNWNYVVGPFGTTPGTGTVMQTTSNPLNLTGLTPATAYVFWVQDSCGPGDVSTWSGPYNFSTLCNTFSLNYSEDFTTWSAPNPPTCWDNQGGTNQALLYSAGANQMARFNFWSWLPPANAVLTSPAINISQKARLKFSWARQGSGFYTDSLVILSKPTTASTWDVVAVWSNPDCQCGAGTTTPGTLVDSILPLDTNYVGQDIQIRFVGISDWGPDFFLDNVIVEVDPQFASCPAPQGLTASGITSTAANLAWTSTASNNQISWGQGSFAASQGTLVTTANNPYLLSGLSGNTTYSYYVRAICSATDTSVWNGPFSFTTACASYTLPFNDNLDGTSWVPDNINFSPTSDNVDQCWTRTPAGTSYSWRVRSLATGSTGTGPSSDVSGTGNYIYTESSYGATGNQAEIISPIINMANAVNPYLRFYYHFYGTQINRMYVEGYNGTSWTILDSIVGQQQTSETAPWQDTLVSLASYAGTANFQFRMRAISAGCCAGDLAIDEFSVFDSSAAPCATPTNFAASSIACDNVVLDWNSASGTILSGVVYGPAGFNPLTGGTQIVPAVAPLTIGNLTASTAYDVYLIDSCAAGTSAPQVLNISTPNAPVPTISYSTNQISTTATSADVEFDATGSSNYTSVLWDFGGGNTNPNPVATYTYTMNQTYSVTLTLTNGCGTVDSTFDVTVTGIGINETALAKSLNIYPNPTNGAFTVRFALEKREAVNITVLDPIGRIIERKDLGTVEGATEIAFDLSDEASGVYMVQITTDSGVITKRITVRNK